MDQVFKLNNVDWKTHRHLGEILANLVLPLQASGCWFWNNNDHKGGVQKKILKNYGKFHKRSWHPPPIMEKK